MLNKNVIDEINAKVGEILQNSPAKDLEKNFQNSDIIKNGFSYNFTTGKKKSTSFQDELVKCRNNSDS